MLPDPLPGNVADFPNFTWREYGQRAGVWRLFRLFEEAGVPMSLTMNAKMGTERPEVIRFGLDRGWEVVAHNYEQGELLTRYTFDPAAERDLIRRTLEVYKQVCGRPARGWLSSSLRSTPTRPTSWQKTGCCFSATT